MNTPVEDNNGVENPQSAEACCDAACSCHSGGLSTGAKLAICLVVAAAAAAVVLLNSAHNTHSATAGAPFASPRAGAGA